MVLGTQTLKKLYRKVRSLRKNRQTIMASDDIDSPGVGTLLAIIAIGLAIANSMGVLTLPGTIKAQLDNISDIKISVDNIGTDVANIGTNVANIGTDVANIQSSLENSTLTSEEIAALTKLISDLLKDQESEPEQELN